MFSGVPIRRILVKGTNRFVPDVRKKLAVQFVLEGNVLKNSVSFCIMRRCKKVGNIMRNDAKLFIKLFFVPGMQDFSGKPVDFFIYE